MQVQYVALRNINLIVQKRPDILKHEMKVFFVKYNDPIYVKLEKLDIMIRLASQANIAQVLSELKEWVVSFFTHISCITTDLNSLEHCLHWLHLIKLKNISCSFIAVRCVYHVKQICIICRFPEHISVLRGSCVYNNIVFFTHNCSILFLIFLILQF